MATLNFHNLIFPKREGSQQDSCLRSIFPSIHITNSLQEIKKQEETNKDEVNLFVGNDNEEKVE